MRAGTRSQLPEDLMNTAPPRGFILRKRREEIQPGDMIMTANIPGSWNGPVKQNNDIIGCTGIQLAQFAGAEVKIAKKQ